MNNEPARKAAIAAVVGALVLILAHFGVKLAAGTESDIVTAIDYVFAVYAIVAPYLAGRYTRARVTPTQKVIAYQDEAYGPALAGDAAPQVTGTELMEGLTVADLRGGVKG